MGSRHAKWAAYLQELSFTIWQKAGTDNKVADAFSWKVILLSALQVQVTGFNTFTDLYAELGRIGNR